MRAEAGMHPHHHHHDGAEERARLHCTAVTKGGTRDDVTNPARPGRRLQGLQRPKRPKNFERPRPAPQLARRPGVTPATVWQPGVPGPCQ